MTGPTTGAAGEASQLRDLARARRNATVLLVAVGVAFLGATQLPPSTAAGYVVAALEAGLIGGLADWFAVVALFRHPLGLPIPHTAVIPRSKDGLGANLATFVEGNFLADDQVRDRVADPVNVDRLAGLLADRDRADRLVTRAAEVLDATLGAVDERAFAVSAAAAVRRRLVDVPVSRLAGQALGEAILARRHDGLVTAVLAGVVDTITANRSALRQRLGQQSPSWVPQVVDDLVFDRGEQVVRTFLLQLASDEDHELRRALDHQLLAVTTQMRTDEATQERIQGTVHEVLTDQLLERWIARWWQDVRVAVAAAAVDDDRGRALRTSAVDPVVELGERLHHDQDLRARALGLLAQAAEPIAAIGQREVGGLIEATVDRWDPEDTSRRLELWLGRDLQFVRINGTLVGAAVGVLLHAVQSLL